MDIGQIIELTAPFVTGLGGAFIGFKVRLAALEKNVATLTDKVDANNQGNRLLYTGLETTIRAELNEEVKKINDEQEALVNETKDYQQEQQRQWTEANRTLGSIEGWLQATQERAPTVPRPNVPLLPRRRTHP